MGENAEIAKIKDMNSGDPLIIEKGASNDANQAAKDVNEAAKKTVSKVLGQDTKPTAWFGGALQVNVDVNPVEQVLPDRQTDDRTCPAPHLTRLPLLDAPPSFIC